MFATTFATTDSDQPVANRLANAIVPSIPTALAEPGDVIIAQLGNETDSYWNPAAELFVISFYEGFGQRYYNCVGVRDDGTMFVKFGVYYREDTNKFYSTTSRLVSELDGRGEKEATETRELIRQYIGKILLIKPYAEIDPTAKTNLES